MLRISYKLRKQVALRGKLTGTILNFEGFGGCKHTFLQRYKREIWHEEADGPLSVPHFTFIGAACHPRGDVNPFWTTELTK